MLGMEKMIASLIGMEPEELQAKVKEIETVFTTLADAMQAMSENQKLILEKQDLILDKLERLENEQRTNSDN